MRRIRYAALAAVLGLASISAAHAAIESPIHRSFNVRPGGTITIDADLGDIKVTSGGSNVSVDVIRRARTSSQSKADDLFKDLVVSFTPEGDSVRIRAKYDQPSSWFHWNWNNDLDVRFVVSVPSQYNVDLKTSGGDITVSDLNGQAKVNTSGGDVSLGHIAGAVDAHTSGGDISMAGSQANAMLSTSGGDIKVDNTTGALNVKTSGGSIDIGRAQGDLKAHTPAARSRSATPAASSTRRRPAVRSRLASRVSRAAIRDCRLPAAASPCTLRRT